MFLVLENGAAGIILWFPLENKPRQTHTASPRAPAAAARCPVIHEPRGSVLEPHCISQDRSKYLRLAPLHFLLIPFKEKVSLFSCSPNDKVKERDFSSLISLTCLGKERREEQQLFHKVPCRRGAPRVTSSQSVPSEGGQLGCVNATVPLWWIGSWRSSPALALLSLRTHALSCALAFSHTRGAGEISSFFLSALYRGNSQVTTWAPFRKRQ